MIDYDKLLTDRVKHVKPSGIRRFFDIANKMENVISLGIGEPDFPTPWEIREAGIESLKHKKTKYTANSGLEKLRERISNYIDCRINIKYSDLDEIIVTVGGSEAIDLCIRALVEPGDEVIIPQPSFVCYEPITTLVGGVPVIINTKSSDGFKLNACDLKNAITEKTKLLILPFPNNPTGAVMRKKDLDEIAEVLKNTNIIVLSDEIYSELTYGDTPHHSIVQCEGMRERTVLINGFSKSFSMTGWRLGFACGPEPIIKQMLKIHQFAIMSSPTTSQYSAIKALENFDDYIKPMAEEYDMRRKFIVYSFNKLGLTCFNPEGAFYVFPSIAKTGLSSEEFCERLLNEQLVALVPGSAFGECGDGFVRVSYAYSLKHIKEAISRIEKFMEQFN